MIPVASAIMILLGMRFVFGSQRHVSMGKRITLGVLAGISFYVLTQVVNHFGSLLGFPPLVIAVVPSIIALITMIVVYKLGSVET